MENIYKEGQVVYERVRPTQKLIVMRHVCNMYYCQADERSDRKELVFFERELMPNNVLRK